MKPRILLVDDHEIVRKGIKEMSEGQMRSVCGEAATGEGAVQKVLELKPDVVVMDYRMPGMDGAATRYKQFARLPRQSRS